MTRHIVAAVIAVATIAAAHGVARAQCIAPRSKPIESVISPRVAPSTLVFPSIAYRKSFGKLDRSGFWFTKLTLDRATGTPLHRYSLGYSQRRESTGQWVRRGSEADLVITYVAESPSSRSDDFRSIGADELYWVRVDVDTLGMPIRLWGRDTRGYWIWNGSVPFTRENDTPKESTPTLE
jgi:hypothetical protein